MSTTTRPSNPRTFLATVVVMAVAIVVALVLAVTSLVVALDADDVAGVEPSRAPAADLDSATPADVHGASDAGCLVRSPC